MLSVTTVICNDRYCARLIEGYIAVSLTVAEGNIAGFRIGRDHYGTGRSPKGTGHRDMDIDTASLNRWSRRIYDRCNSVCLLDYLVCRA